MGRFISHLSGLALSIGTAISPALALPQDQLTTKLDTILLLMAVNENGEPKAVPAMIDGRNVETYFSAISVAGAEAINDGKVFGIAPNLAKTFRFTPVSLAKFNQILEPELKKNPTRVAVIAPDPLQAKAAEKLLIEQKIPADKAKSAVEQQPMIFCPEPGLLVSLNEGPDKGEQFLPCSTEYSFVQSITQKAKQDPKLAKSKPHVVAIPLNNFIAFLEKAPEDQAGKIKVVPSGQIVSLIQNLSKEVSPSNETKPSKKTK